MLCSKTSLHIKWLWILLHWLNMSVHQKLSTNASRNALSTIRYCACLMWQSACHEGGTIKDKILIPQCDSITSWSRAGALSIELWINLWQTRTYTTDSTIQNLVDTVRCKSWLSIPVQIENCELRIDLRIESRETENKRFTLDWFLDNFILT